MERSKAAMKKLIHTAERFLGLTNRVVIVMEISCGPKNFALNYFPRNFTEVVMNANKVNPENLVAVR